MKISSALHRAHNINIISTTTNYYSTIDPMMAQYTIRVVSYSRWREPSSVWGMKLARKDDAVWSAG